MKKNIYTVIFSLLFILCGTQVMSESLWDDKAASIFSDSQAHSVGDSITVIIAESSSAYQKADTKLNNSSDAALGPVASAFLPTGLGTKLANASTMKEADKFSGQGSTERSGMLSAKVTVKITKILDNGEYEIDGSKEVAINSELQKITIKGSVRPADIDENNTVLSTSIADAQIAYSGTGPVGDSQEPGIISKIIAWLF